MPREMLRALASDDRVSRIHFIASESSLRVFAEELSLSGRNNLAEKLLGSRKPKLHSRIDSDIGASIASGSYPAGHGCSSPLYGNPRLYREWFGINLIHRAADVCLRSASRSSSAVRAKRPSTGFICATCSSPPTPAATIFPAIPTLYNHPQDTTEMARNFVHRVLAHIGLPQPGAYRVAGRRRLVRDCQQSPLSTLDRRLRR